MEFITGILRHLLTTGGGYLTAKGLATEDEVGILTGAVIALVGIGLSMYSKWSKK